MTVALHHGNCLEIIHTLPDCSIDSIVTDPPYELGFMGKKWDASGIAYNVTLWFECLRVLKPGGHLLAFGGTRTYHRMACAIEDAGFEVRDSIHWLYGSGFPKSLDVSKAIDKAAGADREVVGSMDVGPDMRGGNYERAAGRMVADITSPATDEARTWAGWGTALKPAHEPIVVARKPLEGTVAANVLKYGTGAINIDGTRIGYQGDYRSPARADGSVNSAGSFGAGIADKFDDAAREQAGRWPANIILSHHEDCQQIGVRDETYAMNTYSGRGPFGESQVGNKYNSEKTSVSVPVWECVEGCAVAELDQQNGGASRFFYCAKPSRRERNAGLDGFPERETLIYSEKAQGPLPQQTPSKPSPRANHHPTVKPLALMRYLVRLVTPPNGIILEPFAGSGTTLMAAVLENFNAIGIEMTDEYLPIIEGRVAWAEQEALTQQEQLQL